MEFIQWHDSFSVGVNIIDDQHQQLFMLVNELIFAINTQKEEEVLDRILLSVLDYTEMHFRTEEELFKIHSQFKAHCDIHHQFVQQIRGLAVDFTKNKAGAAVRLLNDLITWLQHHILKTDIVFFSELGYRPRETKENFEERLQLLTHKEKVLIVDDSPIQRELLRINLEKAGYSILEACNGIEALKIIESTSDLHLLVADIVMPDMNGYDLIEAILDKEHLSIYIIVSQPKQMKRHRLSLYVLALTIFSPSRSVTRN